VIYNRYRVFPSSVPTTKRWWAGHKYGDPMISSLEKKLTVHTPFVTQIGASKTRVTRLGVVIKHALGDDDTMWHHSSTKSGKA